jgi:hypothetical protein
MLVLFLLSCMGEKRVGCAAGESPKYPSMKEIIEKNYQYFLEKKTKNSEEKPVLSQRVRFDVDDETVSQEEQARFEAESAGRMQWDFFMRNAKNRIRRVRIWFLFGGLLVLGGSSCLLVSGFTLLNNGYKNIQSSVQVRFGYTDVYSIESQYLVLLLFSNIVFVLG